MKKFNQQIRKASGQSVVEMIITLFAFFTIFFMYVQVALSFSVANFVHYATFMAARAFLSGGQNYSTQRQSGMSVITKMLKKGDQDRFAGIIKATGEDQPKGVFVGATTRVTGGASGDPRNTAWEQGVTYKFKVKLYMMPLIKSRTAGKGNSVELQSQSWLGREPTEEECKNYMEHTAPGQRGVKGVFALDNGC